MEQKSQLATRALFDAKTPRYSSYPSVSHFSPAVNSGLKCQWLSSIPANSSISIYLHVPFCRKLCWFCAYRTQSSQSDGPIRSYVEALKREISLVLQSLPPGTTVSRLHFGGGTPTILPADVFADLCATLTSAIPLASDYEFAVEVDPNDVDLDRVAALQAAGVNSVSMGIQDFDPEVQAAIGRTLSFDRVSAVVEDLRAHHIGQLTFDVLYGLPHQTGPRLTDTLQMLLSLSPDRFSVCNYSHVPALARRQSMIPSEALPPPPDRLRLFETAERLLQWDGYQPIGMDHFSRPDDRLAIANRLGRLRRDFRGYSDDPNDVLIGLGASAVSRFPQGYCQNEISTSGYEQAIAGGHHATTRGHVFKNDDRLRGEMIERLLCDLHLSGTSLARDLDMPVAVLDLYLDQIATGLSEMLQRDEHGIAIKPEARPFARMIASRLDRYALPAI